jgi:hypothetical protein
MTYLDEVAAAVRACVPDNVEVPDNADDLFRLYAVLARAKGTSVTDEDVHDAWVAWMSNRGKQHDAMVPFDELGNDVGAQDGPFADAIRTAARGHRAPHTDT